MWNLNILGFSLYFLFYNFILYCFFGWIYESCLVSFRKKAWVNRGFLNGPILPIYGAGATIVYIFIAPIQDNSALVFVIGALLATILEYVTSYVMERLFHAKWWDYSNNRYNIKGRVCLLATMFWGFLSILMTDVLQPAMNSIINWIPRRIGEVAGVVIFVLFVIDIMVTVVCTLQLDQKFAELAKIREEISDYLESTRLYETKEEWKNRFEELSIASISDSFREQLDLRVTQIGSRFENREELEQKFKGIVSRYNKSAELKNIVHKRILRAFPNMKSLRSDKILDDLRKKRK